MQVASAALFEATEKGNYDAVEEALSTGMNPSVRDPCQLTPLHVAARRGFIEICHLLVSHGCDINAANRNGLQPIHHAAQGGSVECITLLIESGALPRTRDASGMTPLHHAAYWDQADMLLHLLKYSNADERDYQGWTALMYASQRGNLRQVILLLQAGCDVSLRNKHGQTASEIARDYERRDVAQLLSNAEAQRGGNRGPAAVVETRQAVEWA
eukprot:GDKH01006002.1.p1 GENE.GDKH01006002.1~~GDKH01006002.1.p1  ORF type:complete len:214 (+),score=39.79 GDKH01006002.1:126-767(+)